MTEIESKYQTFWRRFGALLIDILIIAVAPALFIAFLPQKFHHNIILQFVLVSIASGYFIYSHSTSGRTVGKKAVGLKVIHEKTEKNLTIAQAFYRELPNIIMNLSYLINYKGQEADSLLTAYEGQIALYWLIGEIACVFNNPKRRALHDYIAGSVVIKEEWEKDSEIV